MCIGQSKMSEDLIDVGSCPKEMVRFSMSRMTLTPNTQQPIDGPKSTSSKCSFICALTRVVNSVELAMKVKSFIVVARITNFICTFNPPKYGLIC